MVRHAGVTLALYQAARATGDDTYQAAADRALEWMLGRLHDEDDWTALMEGTTAPLGGSALMLAALAERRLLTGEDTYDDEMRGLGDFLTTMQRDNGDFYVSYDPSTDEPDRVHDLAVLRGRSALGAGPPRERACPMRATAMPRCAPRTSLPTTGTTVTSCPSDP